MRLMRKLSDMIVYIGKQKMYPLLIVLVTIYNLTA